MDGTTNTTFHPDLVEDGDLVLVKKGFSAYAASRLPGVLAELGWDTVVIGGLATPICVATSPLPSTPPTETSQLIPTR